MRLLFTGYAFRSFFVNIPMYLFQPRLDGRSHGADGHGCTWTGVFVLVCRFMPRVIIIIIIFITTICYIVFTSFQPGSMYFAKDCSFNLLKPRVFLLITSFSSQASLLHNLYFTQSLLYFYQGLMDLGIGLGNVGQCNILF